MDPKEQMSKKKVSPKSTGVKVRLREDESYVTDNEWLLKKIAESSKADGESNDDAEVVDVNLLIDELISGLRRLSDALGLNEANWIRIPKPEARVELETVEEVAMQGLLALQWSIRRGRLETEQAKGFTNALRALVGTLVGVHIGPLRRRGQPGR